MPCPAPRCDAFAVLLLLVAAHLCAGLREANPVRGSDREAAKNRVRADPRRRVLVAQAVAVLKKYADAKMG